MTQLRDLLRRGPKRGLEFPPWLDRLVSVGIVSTDPKVVRCQQCVNVAAFATAGDTLSHLVFNAIYNFHGLLPVNAWNTFMLCASVLIPRLHRFGAYVGAITMILLILCGHSFVVWSLGQNSDLQIYFTLAGVTLLFFGLQAWRLFVLFVVLALAALLVVINFAPFDGFIIPEDTALRDRLSAQALVSTLLVNAALYFYFYFARRPGEGSAGEAEGAVRCPDRHRHAAFDRRAAQIGTRAAHRRPHRAAQRAVRRHRRFHRRRARSHARPGGRVSRPPGADVRRARRGARGREDQDHRRQLHGGGRVRRRRGRAGGRGRPPRAGDGRGHRPASRRSPAASSRCASASIAAPPPPASSG